MIPGTRCIKPVFTSLKNMFEARGSRDRASNFEVLRIMAMFFIVFHHYGGEDTFSFDRSSETYRWFNEYWVKSMATTGKVGVSIFLLMTGYFQNGKAIKMSSIARTWFQADCWSYLMAGIWYLAGKNVWEHGWKPLFLPVIHHNYWFVSTYITVACFSGWIAAISKYATPAQYITGLLTMFVVMSLCEWDGFIAFCNTQWFMFVMALGSFLRRFSKNLEWISMRALVVVLALLVTTVYSSTYIFLFHDVDWANRHGGYNALVRENWCPLSLFIGIVLLMIVERTKKFTSPALNKVSGLSLGVYLVHEHILVRHVIWKDWVQGIVHRDRVLLPLITLIQVCSIYLICSFLEYLRQTAFQSVETHIADFVAKVSRNIADRLNTSFSETDDEKLSV